MGTSSRIQRLKFMSAAVLFIGLAASVAVYIVADQESDGMGYEMVGGNLYPSANERSKKYMHDVELYGGKAAVFADDINRCINGMWQGTALAYTLAFLTVMVSGGLFLAARFAQAEAELHEHDDDHKDGG
jgi:uncharacterized membrane protein YjgN (DUF898 family)